MLQRTNKHLQTLEAWLAAISLLALLSLSIFQILLRNIFDFGYPEIDIINRHLLVISGMMGAVLATSRNAHIKTDALNVLLSPAIKEKLRFPLKIFASIICLLLAYYATTFVSDEWTYAPANERWTLPFTLIYPFSFALMGWHFIIDELLRPGQNGH
ncbi:MAG TPA: TRAP transporter small permease [Gammaproteobacteria bacterium]|nr:TRAP transporter small permease [Gammaproteobacteria bacterium]